MKSKTKFFTVLMALLVLLAASTITVSAEDTISIKVQGKYGQTEARSMLNMINTFRTGSDAWQWNENNTEKVKVNNLKKLAYDYELEKVAMQRAMEIAISFDHERPGGGNVFSMMSWNAAGENIAAGYTSASAAFQGWQETNEKYAGQGHRRNMLSPYFTAVGIGHVYYNGCHYWVQVFRAPTGSTSATSANDSTATKTIEILPSVITSKSVKASVSSISVPYGGTVALPSVTTKIATRETWPGGLCSVTAPYQWTLVSGGSKYASISSGKITGKAYGKTYIQATVLGKTVKVSVEVVPVKKGMKITDKASGAKYKVTKAGKSGTVEYLAPASTSKTSVSIPATITINKVKYKVTSISASAFKNNKKLKKVTISGNVETIGKSAFENCTALEKITIPAKVKKIGSKAFYNCKKLKSVTVKTKKLTAKNVGSKAFTKMGSSNYKKVKVKVPKSKSSAYKKMFKQKGLSAKAKVVV